MADDSILDISLTRIEKPVRIDGKIYAVKEMTGAQRDRWLTQMGNRMKTDADGKPTGIREFDGVQAGLISLCLYDGDVPVPVNVIQSWPAKAQNQLFKLCQEVNGLGDEQNVEAAKND